MNTLSRNIRNLRKKAGMTQEELAEKLYTTRQTISNYETGKSEPDFETLRKIADAFSVETADLLSDSQHRKNHSELDTVRMTSILLMVLNFLGLAWGFRLTDDSGLQIILSLFCLFNLLLGIAVYLVVRKINPKEFKFELNWIINFRDQSIQLPNPSKLKEIGDFEPFGSHAFRGWSPLSLKELVNYIEKELHYDQSQFEVYNSPARYIHLHSDDLDRNMKS